MGRFRRGSRGPKEPAPAHATGAKGPESAPEAGRGALTRDQVALVDRMARTYQGVGRRTAERLITEFGDDVLRVIDDEPGRIEKLLPAGRAHAVIDGRRVEREAGGESG